jgi:arylsulfatase A-like enzyme
MSTTNFYAPVLLLTTLLILPACAPSESGTGENTGEQSPNILFVFSDDQRADALGAYGNPYVETPHQDSLAENGFNFLRAHVMGSHHGAVCAPSRAMLMSGRNLFRVYDDLDSVRTFPQALREAGYLTFGTGKWHQSQASFQKSFSRGENIFFGGMSDHFAVPVRDIASNGQFSSVEEEGFSSTLFTDAAVEFIDDYAVSDTSAPFFAYVSFTAPHDPRTPPDSYLRRYEGEDMPLPPNFKPVHPFNLGQQTMTIRDEQLAPWPRTPEVIRAQYAEYYGLISHMDAQIGRLLDALRRHGLEENTIVVFASDNGLALGSHGLLGKQNLYNHSTRVPLIVSGKGIPQGNSEALVYLFDLAPTILGLTKVEGLEGMDGRDLAPLWNGEQDAVRDLLMTAYRGTQRAVRDARWKLIHYPLLDHSQLFDLQEDPYELNNLAADSTHRERRIALMDSMRALQQRFGDPHPLEGEERASMVFDYSDVERSPDRHQPPYILERYFQ